MSLVELNGPCGKCGENVWRLGRVAGGLAEFFCFYCGATDHVSLTPEKGEEARVKPE